MPIIEVFDFVSNTFVSIISGLFQFLVFIINLPIFLASLFSNLPSIFYVGFFILFSIVVIALYIRIYHMLKG